ncbi:metal ABC transporter ATP-binding protein [Shinella sp. HZN7]|uniref:metal ABC transporter ATP-binding protein n=1 Tax=Shinella sp. (strain HZN7) TaxID=879274 RepID=UPI000AE7A92B|nr:metal ABC transporter ATP-binding protein [Shinella sp. HZN7]
MNAPMPPLAAAEAIVGKGPAVVFDEVSLVLGRTDVLSRVTLRIEPGTVHAVVGPNGGGKSSLVRCLLGQAPHTGTVRIDWPGDRGTTGYVPQALEFDRGLPMTVMDFLAALVAGRPSFLTPEDTVKTAILAALADVGMEGKAGRRMGALSGGERQRVMMAQGLMPPPDLLVLDEPMAALDEAGARIFERLIGRLQERGTTILWVEHDLAAVRRFAGRVTGLSRAVLFDGAPEAELTPERVLALFSHRAGGVA